jgi:heme/copper-type cytochrome/quinol oxidase subunit 2
MGFNLLIIFLGFILVVVIALGFYKLNQVLRRKQARKDRKQEAFNRMVNKKK